jgi:predicted nucleic acid-binding protein
MLISNAGTLGQVFEHALVGDFQLVLLEEVEIEYYRVARSKPFLRQRFISGQATQFMDQMRSVAEYCPIMDYPVQSFSRDQKDDYLVSYALMLDVDYLVTGDKDLLVIRSLLDRPRIVTPAEFLSLIRS